MTLYCTEEFKREFERLEKSSSYAGIGAVLVKTYCGATFDEARSGDLLNDLVTAFFVKKRLEGRGGFRFYVLAVIKDESIYLTFVHPKTGRHGADNITKAKHHELLKEVLRLRKQGGIMYELKPVASDSQKVEFLLRQAAPVITTA
ncbi:hypothetical protein [Hymenobacter rubidus]|uniref:hypothetical protein n=1 Tax=Hymenobacter rubidus TaxID=1441626 RepID=UPI00191EAFFB|nr:hypothetical protein [Hymenobacter rubidus]